MQPVPKKRLKPIERMKALVEQMIPNADPGSAKVHPARGFYTTRHADCMGFTGSVTVGGVHRSIGSWDTLTRCLRNGCILHSYVGDARAYADFEFEAKDGPVPSKAEQLRIFEAARGRAINI